MAVSLETVNVLRLFSLSTAVFYLTVSAIILWYIYFQLSRKRMYKIDGPNGLPLLGNSLDFITDPHSKSTLILFTQIDFTDRPL